MEPPKDGEVGGKGMGGLVLLAQVRHDKVEDCLVMRREAHDLGEVQLVLDVADIQAVKVTAVNELCRLVSHPGSVGKAYKVFC